MTAGDLTAGDGGGRPARIWNPPLHALTGEGLFPVEEHAGQVVRWTTPWCTLNIISEPSDSVVTLDTGGLRGWPSAGYVRRMHWNEHAIDIANVSLDEQYIRVQVRAEWCIPGDIQKLRLFSLALNPDDAQDGRRLGVPLVSVSLSRAAHTTSEERPEAVLTFSDVGPIRSPTAGDCPPYKVVSVNTSDFGGGAERSAWTIFQGLQQAGIDSWLVVGEKRTDDPRVIPFHASPYIRHPRRGGLDDMRAWAQYRLGAFLGREDFDYPLSWRLPEITGSAPDAVLLHNLHGPYFDLRALEQLSSQLPVILSVRDSWLFTGHCATTEGCERWQTGCGQCPDLKRYPPIARDATAYNWTRKAAAFQKARLYLAAPSHWTLSRVERSLIAPSVVESRVIPNGVDLTRFYTVDKAQSRLELPLSADGPLIVLAACQADGTLKDKETTEAFLQILPARLVDRPAQIVVVGAKADSSQRGALMVHFTPRMPQDQLARFLQAADIYVHISREEAFGRVVAEAMACGTTVVATEAGGVGEVLGAVGGSNLVPRADASALAQRVSELCAEPACLASMGRASAERAREHFDDRHMVRAYLEWIEEICSGPVRRARLDHQRIRR